MSAGDRVTLHVGTSKTGTTSIQHFLRANSDLLARHGLLYPRSPGRTRHMRLGLSIRSDEELARTSAWVVGDYPDPATFRRRFWRRLEREISERGLPRVLLSDEYLWRTRELGAVRAALERLTQDDLARVGVLVYLRRQDERLVSMYQQGVKSGETERLVTVARERRPEDYAARLSDWAGAVGPARLEVRRFERARFAGGNLHQDVLDALGLPLRAADMAVATARNESLAAEAVEYLRIYNLHRVENHGARPRMIDNRAVLPALMSQPGPTLTLPEAALADWFDLCAEANRAVARRYFGEDDLFGPPTRSSSTTTHQLLDPTRLDHYLDLTQVDAAERPAIRTIAEREAAAAGRSAGT